MVTLILFAVGCSSPVGLSEDISQSSWNPRIGSRPSSTFFDAGILFANETSYLCIPFEKLGIESGKEIVSIKSSCECVRPSVVHYLLRKSEEGIALRLDFVEVEDWKSQVEVNPNSLGVKIEFQFASGTEQSVTIQFLQTLQKGIAS